MKFLIFGGTGFIGNVLTTYLKEKGEEVVCVSRSGDNNSIALDITNEKEFNKIQFQPDVVVNCASRIPAKNKSSNDPEFLKELFLTNIIGAANITNWSVKRGVPRIFNCSTLVVVNKPWPKQLTETSVAIPSGPHVGYAMSKLSQEQVMNECTSGSQTKITHLRLSAVYGDDMQNSGLIFNLLEKLERNEAVSLTDAEKNTLDFINVLDISKSIYALAEHKLEENIMNMASGKPVSILDLAEMLKKITQSNSEIIDIETERPASKANIDMTKFKKIFGDSFYEDFISLEDGLKPIAKNFKEKKKTRTSITKN